MTDIILEKLEPQLKQRLQQRATQNGRTIEAEITAILSAVLLPESDTNSSQDLARSIAQRFAPLGEFDIPETPREAPMFFNNTKSKELLV
ncbi:FitA-like ribbon-helix-helix domain-containing protein [Geminocystis sp. CENA526]|uniref:FitA-like ribbon-helix-helix domain-containing protein n=1 Tax=Geminocystis sp. CENA526 TaxID=1355871 RepID=UPI003D6DDEFD